MKTRIVAVMALVCVGTLVLSGKAVAAVAAGKVAMAGKTMAAAGLKPRLVVLTDIAPNTVEPDDMESLIRLLVHADLFEVEALVATTGWSNTGGAERVDLIHNALDAYETDLAVLMKRSNQKRFARDESRQAIGYWPSAAYFRSRTVLGSTKMGMRFVGEGNDSEGSDRIIRLADENDDRPIWISVWGGGNTFAQAVWRVQKERSPEQLKAFLNKFRVYTITDQDRPWSRGDTVNYQRSSHQWLRTFADDLMFFWDECAWKLQNETGVRNWKDYETQIQQHGHLGALYPKYKWGVEGDTPAFMHVIPLGLSDPNVPGQVSWSGYFEFALGRDGQTRSYGNDAGSAHEIASKYFNYFYPAMFNNFAARMDWAKEGKGNRNPVVVVNKSKELVPMEVACAPGDRIRLDASRSYDPDGDALDFRWWVLPEAGTYTGKVSVSDASSEKVIIDVPADAAGFEFHVICEVHDVGVPSLVGYRRVIFRVGR